MKTVTILEASWHYRLYRWLNQPGKDGERKEPQGLCGYVWTLILQPPAMAFVALVAIGVLLITLPLWGTVLLVLWLAARRNARKTGTSASGFALIESYVEARKARVCPRVTVVRDRTLA